MEMKLPTHFHLVPRLKNVTAYLHSHIRHRDLVLNYLSPGITLPFSFTPSLKFRTSCLGLVLCKPLWRTLGRADEMLYLAACSIWTAIKRNCLIATSLLPASSFLPFLIDLLTVSKICN
jgi:hypothetical protein